MADALPVGGPPISGSTKLAGVIGSPVRHSRSPALINAAFAVGALDWRFVAFEVAPGGGAAAIDAMRALGIGGLSVTMPHKHDVIASLDRISPDAAALDAVNCVAWEGEELVGHNTDGVGLLDSLRVDHQVTPDGLACAVVGAGGAARSVIRSLGMAGAADVAVINRTPERAEQAASLAGAVGRVGHLDDVPDADLVINATSVGMGAAPDDVETTPIPPALLHAGQVVVDLVYLPLETPLLALAAANGARPIDGLGMLVHQAAHAVQHWTGVAPDVAAMAAAARS